MTDLGTPYLVVDLEAMQRNIAAMATMARSHGLALRPHAKTHKCLEIARRQLDAGATGLTVATVGEAAIFAAAGLTDLFIAYPIWAAGQRGRRLRAVAEQGSLRVGVDSVEAAAMLGRALAGTGAQVLVEVDSGQHRSGVDPPAAAEVAVAAARAGLDVAGVFTFPGHSYGPGRARSVAAEEAAALAEAAQSLTRAGIEATVRSGGSTPSVAFVEGEPLTEVRPGVYVFNDAQQVELGTCGWPDVALTVAATVVSRRPSRIILDSGSKVLGADQQSWATGAGRLPDHPGARIVALSEHHATVVLADDDPLPGPELGDVIRVAPNHVCAAVNLVEELVVVSGGMEVDRWPVAARGAND
jgi:D-serine deaminase-like pyridoxal phosphate-dependent protein